MTSIKEAFYYGAFYYHDDASADGCRAALRSLFEGRRIVVTDAAARSSCPFKWIRLGAEGLEDDTGRRVRPEAVFAFVWAVHPDDKEAGAVELAQNALAILNANRERYVAAFLAETGIKPSEAEIWETSTGEGKTFRVVSEVRRRAEVAELEELRGVLARVKARHAADAETLDEIASVCGLRGYCPVGGGDPRTDLATWLAQRLEPRPGVCSGCGCTDNFGCEEGCGWADEDCTRCTRCALEGQEAPVE